MSAVKFKTKLVSPQKGWTFLYIPNQLLGTSHRVWLRGKVNGKPFQATANPWRNETHIITVNTKMREELGLRAGDQCRMEFEIITAPPPEPGTPTDLVTALQAHPKALGFFQRIPPSHRKEYIEYIEEAKKPETRARRIAKTMEMILEKSQEQSRP